jgi:hypothetical protein
MVGPAVVVGHGTVRKDSIHQHPQSPDQSEFGSSRLYHGRAAGVSLAYWQQ